MCISRVHLKFRQFSSPYTCYNMYKGWARDTTKYARTKKNLLTPCVTL